MRIVSGKYRGRRINPPGGLPVRPTTDQAKEGLFNILVHRFGIEGARVLDLFCGTGNISFEFLSRGAERVLAVDKDFKCIDFVRSFATVLRDDRLQTLCSDASKMLETTGESFDLIFMDPPYEFEGTESIINRILDSKILNPGGLLIVEHRRTSAFKTGLPASDIRVYGDSAFSFFLLQE